MFENFRAHRKNHEYTSNPVGEYPIQIHIEYHGKPTPPTLTIKFPLAIDTGIGSNHNKEVRKKIYKTIKEEMPAIITAANEEKSPSIQASATPSDSGLLLEIACDNHHQAYQLYRHLTRALYPRALEVAAQQAHSAKDALPPLGTSTHFQAGLKKPPETQTGQIVT